MKISNNALNFLLAQYRAIFKRAYIKGLASAVILTAGLAAGQAQAVSTEDPFWTTTNDSTWDSGSSYVDPANSYKRIAGDYDTGKAEDKEHGNGIVSGAGLVIGSSGSGGDIGTISSGNAYGGYVSIASGNATDATASGNSLTIVSGATIDSPQASGGNIVGGWAKTNGTGFATAQENKLIINAQEGVTITAANEFIGGAASAIHGAKAEGNLLQFTGNTESKTATMSELGYVGGLVFVGADNSSNKAKSGSYQALGNTVDMSNFTVSGDSSKTGNKSIFGGWVAVQGLETNHTIELLRAQGNEVKLTNFVLGKDKETAQDPQVGNIIANYVSNTSGTIASVEANGADNKGVVLTNGNIYGATVFGGFALNVSGGSAKASNNLIQITDTDFLTSVSGTGTPVYNGIFGGHAESTLTDAKQTVNLTASNNTVTIETKAKDTSNVHGSIRGAELYLTSGGAGITDAVGSTLTADYNSITIGEGIAVTEGSIQGVYLGTDQDHLNSGGATLHASNNTVTLNGDWTPTESKQNLAAVIAEKGLLTAENNKVVINGKVDASASGALIAAVVASEQTAIDDKLTEDKIVNHLSNNTVEIGADAEVIKADIFAAQSTKTSAYTLNNDVTIAGKVTNSKIYGGTGADSVIAAQAGSRLTYSEGIASNESEFELVSDVVNLAGIVDVRAHNTVKVRGFLTNGNINAGTYNTNETSIASTAEIYNGGTIELFGDTTVAAGAKLHATTEGATLTVNGDKGGITIKDDASAKALNVDLVGGRGQLTISKDQLKSYLTAGDDYTLDSASGTQKDKAGTVAVTSGGVLEFSDNSVDLATFDYSTTAEAGKIKVDTDTSTNDGTVLKGNAVTISHALASNGTKVADGTITLNKDGKFGDEYSKLDTLDNTSGVSIEAQDLFLGSSHINDTQSAHIKFAKASAQNSINFTVGKGTYQLASTVAGNHFMRTNDLKSELKYFTALNGTIKGDVDVISGGNLTIEYGHWTAQDDIELVADSSAGQGGSLTVGIKNESGKRNYIDSGDAFLPDATLVLDQALTVNVASDGIATITVDGQKSGGYSFNGEHNRLWVYDEELAQSTVGDDHYVMLDLRKGLNMVGTEADGTIKGKFELKVQSGGVVKMMADDLNNILAQNDQDTTTSGAYITVSDKAHLQVTGDVSADFGDFGQGSAGADNGIKLDGGVLSANSLSLIHAHDSGAAAEDASYIASGHNKIDLGGDGTIAVQKVVINDQQRVTKPHDSTSDNNYASKVIFARGTLDIGESLSSLNDTLVVGDTTTGTGGSATKAYLNFYGADYTEDMKGYQNGTINVDTIEVANGSVRVQNGAWNGNNFTLGASGDMIIGGAEEETIAALSAQSLKMEQGSVLQVLADGKMSVNSVDFSGLAAATFDEDGNGAVDTGVQVKGTLTINGTDGEKAGVKFGAEGSIDIAKNGIVKFGSKATNGAILADGTYTGSNIKLVDGYKQIANHGGELHLGFAGSTNFDGDAIKALKKLLFTSDSFENFNSSTQLASGGILNIGDASFDGIKVNKLTGTGLSGYTAKWDDLKDFSDIYGKDVVNNELVQTNVSDIKQGADKIQGHWGSLSMESGVAAGAQVTIAGDTSLRFAEGNNGKFISTADHSAALGAIVENQKDLTLIGGGEIGKVSLHEGQGDAYKNLTVLEVRDGATTIAAIDGYNTGSIASGTYVKLLSDTTVTGNINNIDTVEAFSGAQVTAANAKVREVDTENSTITIASDLEFEEAYIFGGSVHAKNADMTTISQNDGDVAIINGGRFMVDELFKADSGAQIQVGIDTSNLAAYDDVTEEDITLSDGTLAGGTGYFEVGTLELNDATLVIDPEYDEATAVGAALKFKKNNETYSTNEVGTVVGNIHVGKNAAFGIGANLADTQAAIADFQVGGALDQDKYGSILYLNGQLTLDNGSEVALNAHDVDIRQSLLYTIESQVENQFADLGLGKNTAIIMTNQAFEDSNGEKTGTAIHFDRTDAVVNGQGGDIVLAGDFDLSDKLNIFSDNGNATDAKKTGVKVIGSIDVRTVNGFLCYTLSGDNAGQGVQLQVDKDRAYQVMSEASDPVVATLIDYVAATGVVTGGSNSGSTEGTTEGTTETTPAAVIETESALAQNSRSGANVDTGTTTPSEPEQGSGEGGTGEGESGTGNGENGENGSGTTEPTTPTAPAKSSFLNAVAINTHGAPAEQAARFGVYGGTAQVGLAAANSNADVLAARFGIGANAQSLNVASNGMGGTLWVAPIYKSQDSDGFAAQGLNYGVDFDLYGVALGGDYKVTNNVTVGAMFNVGSGDLDGQGNSAAGGVSNDFDYFGFALYGAYQAGPLTVSADLSYTQVDNDLEGNNGLSKLTASADTSAWSLGVTGQYAFSFAAVDVTPHAGLRFTSLDLDDYTVNSADYGTVASFDSDTMSVFSIPVGITFAKTIQGESWTVTPALDLHVAGQFGDDEAEGSVAWSGTGLKTNVTSEVFDNFTYGATVGIEAQSTAGFSFGLGLGYTGSSNTDEFSAQANARFTF